jgi:hypothetical protein
LNSSGTCTLGSSLVADPRPLARDISFVRLGRAVYGRAFLHS